MKIRRENEGSLSMLKIIPLAMTMKVRRENEDSLKHKQYTNTLHHITELQSNDSHQNITLYNTNTYSINSKQTRYITLRNCKVTIHIKIFHNIISCFKVVKYNTYSINIIQTRYITLRNCKVTIHIKILHNIIS